MIALLFRVSIMRMHAVHQGVSAMERCARARARPFSGRRDLRYSQYSRSCAYCNRNAPVASCNPRCLLTAPFEKIFADYFDYAGRHFLIVGDRLFGWSDVFGTPVGSTVTGANALLHFLRSYFATFGVPEEISSDGGPEFTAFVAQDFMRK